MSPVKKKKLEKLRKQLDKLDDSLIKIIKIRTKLVKQVLNLKDYKNQIKKNT
jgi:chorismate mutase